MVHVNNPKGDKNEKEAAFLLIMHDMEPLK